MLNAPFLRWAGSKRRILPVLVASAPAHFETYVEPFAGSACLFFALRPSKAILGDFNAELMSAYRVARRSPRKIAEALSHLPISDSAYRRARAKNLDSLTIFQRAVRFIYLNRLCFNGVYRTNQDGRFNVPMGTRTGAMPTSDHIAACAAQLRGKTLLTADFEETLGLAHRHDFAYLDPPYSPPRPRKGEYGYGTFGDVDLARLVKAINSAHHRGVRILLSYSASEYLSSAFATWHRRTIKARRHVAAAPRARVIETDMLIANYPIDWELR
jgi:DNA adenine methylase